MIYHKHLHIINIALKLDNNDESIAIMNKKHVIYTILSLIFLCAIFMVFKVKILDNYQIEINKAYETAFVMKDNQIINIINPTGYDGVIWGDERPDNHFSINPNTDNICRFNFSDFDNTIIDVSRKIYVQTKEPAGTVNPKLQQPIEVYIDYSLKIKNRNEFVKYLYINELCNSSSKSTNLLIENKLIDDKLKLNQELDKITNETLKEYSYKEILAYKVALIREITRKFNPIVTAKAQYFTLYDMKFDGIISHNPNDQPAPKNELDLNVKIMKGIY